MSEVVRRRFACAPLYPAGHHFRKSRIRCFQDRDALMLTESAPLHSGARSVIIRGNGTTLGDKSKSVR
jgi:hypothetical protein